MIYPQPTKLKKNAGTNASKKYGWKLTRHNYTNKRDEALEQERIRMKKRLLLPPHKPIIDVPDLTDVKVVKRYEKAMHRYNVAIENYKRKMKQRGLKPVNVNVKSVFRRI